MNMAIKKTSNLDKHSGLNAKQIRYAYDYVDRKTRERTRKAEKNKRERSESVA